MCNIGNKLILSLLVVFHPKKSSRGHSADMHKMNQAFKIGERCRISDSREKKLQSAQKDARRGIYTEAKTVAKRSAGILPIGEWMPAKMKYFKGITYGNKICIRQHTAEECQIASQSHPWTSNKILG